MTYSMTSSIAIGTMLRAGRLQRLDQLWESSASYPMGIGGSFSVGKTVGA
jgi:hypothetical protein